MPKILTDLDAFADIDEHDYEEIAEQLRKTI